MDLRPTDARVALVLPVKRLAEAKTRTGLPAPARAALVLDLLQRTVATVRECRLVSDVVVVTPDPVVAGAATDGGAWVLREARPRGLDVAAARGLDAARRLGATSVGLLMCDLPFVRAEDLDAVVEEHLRGGDPLHVPDQHGTGTTFLVQTTVAPRCTAYGPGSAQRHEALGFRPAASPAPGLRFDVDTAEDLTARDLPALVPGACR